MVKVFYSDITNFEFNQCEVDNFPMLRRDYVNSITDIERKRQSTFVWLLLEKALADVNVSGTFSVDSKGKWHFIDSKVKFSLSHSNNIVAVSVGETEYLGVDVEKCSEKVLKLQAKLGEYKQYNLSNIEYITREWTKKESAYKAGKKCEFNSRKIFDKCGEEYFLTLCSKEMLCDFIYVNAKELINK